MRSRVLCATLLSIAALVAAPMAVAHDLGVARVELRDLETGRYQIEVKLPAIVQAATPVFPPRCALVGEPAVRQRSTIQLVVFEMHCAGQPLGVGDVLVLPWEREGAFVAAHWADGTSAGRFFEGQGGGVEVPISLLRAERRAAAETISHYLALGFEHILLGWDHLAFVLALCLIARGWYLAKLVTAFTVGHSLTLAAAVLGLARLPAPPVEACIALSIAFVAREALRRDGAPCHGVGLTLAFGLLHGLGFASALAESGIQRSEIFLGLVSFNLGVEAGQLAFVLVVLTVVGFHRQLTSQPIDQTGGAIRPRVAQALGILALFWTLERVVGFVA